MAPGSGPAPPEARGRERPPSSSSSSLTSSLDGRRVSPLFLGSHGLGGARAPPRLDLSLCFCVLCVGRFYPFTVSFISGDRNSDWGESFAQIFLIKLSFLRQKKSINRLTGGPRGSGARPVGAGAPPASWPPRAPSRVDSSSHISQIFQKYSLPVFIPFGLCLIWGFLRNIKHATNRNWH